MPKVHGRVQFCSDSIRSDAYFPEWKSAFRKNNFELIEISRINKVSLVENKSPLTTLSTVSDIVRDFSHTSVFHEGALAEIRILIFTAHRAVLISTVMQTFAFGCAVY